MNTKTSMRILAGLLFVLAASSAGAVGGGGHLEPSGVNINDRAALQRGAKLFVNYCLSCHSANYMRYKRLVEDLGLSEEVVLDNMVFPDKKIGDTMTITMTAEDASDWFGKAPPDLSLIGRSRGADWLYAYMRSFYRDDSDRWNNTMLANAAMPHVMWQMQGIQEAVFQDDGHGNRVFDHFTLAEPGTQTPEEYDGTVRDLVTFLDYLGEPAKMKRSDIGVWVILFLAVLAFLSYLMKAEFWRDVH